MEKTENYQEKTLFIINELGLSARQVAEAVGKSTSVISEKKVQGRYNKFLKDDFEKLKAYYIEKLRKIEAL